MPFKINFDPLKSPWFHFLFWTVYFLIAFSIFVAFLNAENAFIRVIITGLTHAILAYSVLYFFIPRFFMNGWYLLHYSLIGIFLTGISIFRVYVDSWLNGTAGVIPVEMFSWMHYAGKALAGLIVVGICHTMKFIEYSWKQQRKETELEHKKIEAELKLLKAQVNPHFLFNALNNIYSLSYTNSKEAPSMILKLSELMRYMLYESNDKLVPLEKEISYLNNYIKLQQLKMAEGSTNITFTVEGNINQKMIPPMLFIPFFENAFKHGNINSRQQGYLKSVLKINEKDLDFIISNSIADHHQKKDQSGGIGLDNVRKRLSLLFHDNYELETKRERDSFKVSLKIQLI